MDVGTKDLRRRLSEILDRVARGERVVVYRRGKPAAELKAVVGKRKRLPSLAEFRSRIRLRGRPLSEEVVKARREERF
jgi:prevent-host-death family protein